MLQSGSVHQITEFLWFTAGLVVTIAKSFYGSVAGLLDFLPASVWVAAPVLVVVLVLHSRLSSRIDEIEATLVQLDAKLDTLQSRLARPRDPDAGERPRR
jgi:hypothetical protein